MTLKVLFFSIFLILAFADSQETKAQEAVGAHNSSSPELNDKKEEKVEQKIKVVETQKGKQEVAEEGTAKAGKEKAKENGKKNEAGKNKGTKAPEKEENDDFFDNATEKLVGKEKQNNKSKNKVGERDISNSTTAIKPTRKLKRRKIFGGKPARPSFYIAQIMPRRTRAHHCGGSLITRQWVLTAAHCTFKFPESSLIVILGTREWNGKDGQVRNIKKKYEHPKYDAATFNYDVVLLKLESEVFAQNIVPIKIDFRQEPQAKEEITVIGWGYTETEQYSNDLLEATIQVVDTTKCRNKFMSRARVRITPVMFCAGARKKDACQGDSGGPAVNDYGQVGLVSFGLECGRRSYSGVYTKLISPEIKEFILNTVNASVSIVNQ